MCRRISWSVISSCRLNTPCSGPCRYSGKSKGRSRNGRTCISNCCPRNWNVPLPEELECTVCGERDFRNCNCGNEGILPYERREVQGKGLVWDDFMFAGKSKIFGYYTNLQMTEKQVTNVNESGKLLLLQIGENFNNEGLFIVLINKEDLARCDFSKCKLEWSQS